MASTRRLLPILLFGVFLVGGCIMLPSPAPTFIYIRIVNQGTVCSQGISFLDKNRKLVFSNYVGIDPHIITIPPTQDTSGSKVSAYYYRKTAFNTPDTTQINFELTCLPGRPSLTQVVELAAWEQEARSKNEPQILQVTETNAVASGLTIATLTGR